MILRLKPGLFCAAGMITLMLASCETAIDAGSHPRDIVVGQPIWFSAAARPDRMPAVDVAYLPDFPVDLYSTAEIGYVAVMCTINSAGRTCGVAGTHPAFEREVIRTLGAWSVNPSRLPDTLGACVWVPVIFNPASAGSKALNATPRLLTVVPIITPRRSSERPNLLRVRLSIDANGAVLAVLPDEKVNPANLPAIREAVLQWRFAPARESGQNVAAEIVTPVLCQAPSRLGMNLDPVVNSPTTARPVKQVAPEYPLALRRAGVAGHAIVEIDIDANGTVHNAVAVESDDPGFSAAAIAAVSRWQFAPARKDGRPVADHQSIPFTFGTGNIAEELRRTEASDKNSLANFSPPDTTPVARSRLAPVYPFALRRDGITGKATVEIKVDVEGHVTEARVVQADQPEFGRALAAAVEEQTFRPAIEHGKTVAGSLTLTQEFDATHLPDNVGSRLLVTDQKHPEDIPYATTLTSPLTVRVQPMPRFPRSATASAGDAVIECFILNTGRAHLPRVVSASDELFGYAAAQAVTGWSFDPPNKDGKPVPARVRIAFKFSRGAVTATIEDRPAK